MSDNEIGVLEGLDRKDITCGNNRSKIIPTTSMRPPIPLLGASSEAVGMKFWVSARKCFWWGSRRDCSPFLASHKPVYNIRGNTEASPTKKILTARNKKRKKFLFMTPRHTYTHTHAHTHTHTHAHSRRSKLNLLVEKHAKRTHTHTHKHIFAQIKFLPFC